VLLNFDYNTLKIRWYIVSFCYWYVNVETHTQNKIIKYVALVKEKNKAVQRNIHVQSDICERPRK